MGPPSGLGADSTVYMKSTYDNISDTFGPYSAAESTHSEVVLEHRLEKMNVSVSVTLPGALRRAKDFFASSACATASIDCATLTSGLPFLILFYRCASDCGSLEDDAFDVEGVDPEPAQSRISAGTLGKHAALPVGDRRTSEHLGALLGVRNALNGNVEDERGPEGPMGRIASPHTADLHAPTVPVGRLRELRDNVHVVLGVVDDVHPASPHIVGGPAVDDAVVLPTGVTQVLRTGLARTRILGMDEARLTAQLRGLVVYAAPHQPNQERARNLWSHAEVQVRPIRAPSLPSILSCCNTCQRHDGVGETEEPQCAGSDTGQLRHCFSSCRGL